MSAQRGALQELRDIVGDVAFGVGSILGRALLVVLVVVGFVLVLGLGVFVLGLVLVLVGILLPVGLVVGLMYAKEQLDERFGSDAEPAADGLSTD